MTDLDRRKLLHGGIALAIPMGGMLLFGGCQQSTDDENEKKTASAEGSSKESATNNDDKSGLQTNQENEQPQKENRNQNMQVQYLEIVTPDVDALCKQYSEIHGITFGEPVPHFGNARTADLQGGGKLGIRAPMRDTESPVVRPYMLVEDIDAAVAAAKEAGAEVAIPKMEIPGNGTFAIVIHGGIECGMWQL